MKRTTLLLDEDLLETATRLLGVKTYSAAVNKALEEVIRNIRARNITQWFGSGVWDGDLSTARENSRPDSRIQRKRRGGGL
jgi:Arc/MetJ family transcription regulator